MATSIVIEVCPEAVSDLVSCREVEDIVVRDFRYNENRINPYMSCVDGVQSSELNGLFYCYCTVIISK